MDQRRYRNSSRYRLSPHSQYHNAAIARVQADAQAVADQAHTNGLEFIEKKTKIMTKYPIFFYHRHQPSIKNEWHKHSIRWRCKKPGRYYHANSKLASLRRQNTVEGLWLWPWGLSISTADHSHWNRRKNLFKPWSYHILTANICKSLAIHAYGLSQAMFLLYAPRRSNLTSHTAGWN